MPLNASIFSLNEAPTIVLLTTVRNPRELEIPFAGVIAVKFSLRSLLLDGPIIANRLMSVSSASSVSSVSSR